MSLENNALYRASLGCLVEEFGKPRQIGSRQPERFCQAARKRHQPFRQCQAHCCPFTYGRNQCLRINFDNEM